MSKTEIITLAGLKARYPESGLRHWLYEFAEDEIDIGWWHDIEFAPTHKVEFFLAGSRSVAFVDYVLLECPEHHNTDRRVAYLPQNRGEDPEFARFRASAYARNRDTNKWWHLQNHDPEWVKGRVKATPVTYMRELPVELRPNEVVGGYVYFIQGAVGGPIKIGWSQDVDKRVAELQTGNPEPLSVINMIPGTKNDERRLHDLLGHLRISGEWFMDHPDVRRWTREIQFAS